MDSQKGQKDIQRTAEMLVAGNQIAARAKRGAIGTG